MDEPTDPTRLRLRAEPLQAETFAEFGDVIDAGEGAPHRTINDGDAERYDDLARLDLGREGGHPVLSLFRARPRVLPMQVRLLERHRLGSQTFMPLMRQRFLIVVAPPGQQPMPAQLRCFMAEAGQGVSYATGTWHHPLIALDAGGDFMVIDRGGPGAAGDCEECDLIDAEVWVEAPNAGTVS